jgi:ABC-type uncharacterized transport system
MSTMQNSDPSTKQPSGWLDRLVEKPEKTAYGLLAAAAGFVVLALVFGLRFRTHNIPITMWALLCGLCFFAAGVWRLLGQSARMPLRDFARLQLLVLGGFLGIFTVLCLGLGLAWTWWDTVMGGWQTWQGKEGWRLWVVILSILGGLALMFVSLHLCQSDERSSSQFRRFVYGYNAVLSAWLLLLVLLVANVLVYVPWGPLQWFNTTNYWARSSMYGLSPRSEKILESLEKPLKVYVLTTRSDDPDVKVLMDNCRQFARKMEVEYLSPDLDRERIEKLSQEYKFGERTGILLVYGPSSDGRNRFIKYSELTEPGNSFTREPPSFRGERVFINELYSLTEDKDKPVIYFTQGNGELDLFDAAPTNQLDKGLGVLKQRLEGSNYKVKGLRFMSVEGAKSPNPDLVIASSVPDDAAIVVVPGPKEMMKEPAISALRNYMNPPPGSNKKPGKMVALLDVFVSPEKTMQQTGLEPLMAEYGIDVGNNVVLTLSLRPPVGVITLMNPDESLKDRNAIAAAFGSSQFQQWKVRTVTPLPPGRNQPTSYRQDPLLMVPPDLGIWAETNVAADPYELIAEFRKRDELRTIISPDPLTIAVAVSESASRMPGNPHASLGAEDKPRLVVVGDVTWVGNRFMAQNLNIPYFDLFSGMLSWLRERPNNIGIEAKKRETYNLTPTADLTRMFLMPTILTLVAIVGLGAGVWVVRRR